MNGERKKMEERGKGEQAREWKERIGKGGKMKVRETKAWEGKVVYVKIIKEWKGKRWDSESNRTEGKWKKIFFFFKKGNREELVKKGKDKKEK